MQGKSFDTGKIPYKDDYSVTNLLDLLTQLGVIFNIVTRAISWVACSIERTKKLMLSNATQRKS